MANPGQTLLRFAGALVLGGLATAMDQPGVWVEVGVHRASWALQFGGGTEAVVVVTRDVPVGAFLHERDLALVQWPVGTIPSGAFTSIAAATRYQTIVPLYDGEAVIRARVTLPGLDGGGITIAPRKQAVTLSVNQADRLRGLIVPGTRVDVLALMSDPATSTVRRLVVMEDLRVLQFNVDGVQVDSAERVAGIGLVTLEVLPRDADRLLRARSSVPLTLAIHGSQVRADSTRGSELPGKPARSNDPSIADVAS